MPSNRTEQTLARLADLTPKQIVAELDRYIVGQADAKKARKKLQLQKPPRKPGEKAWFEKDFTNVRKIRDREIFA